MSVPILIIGDKKGLAQLDLDHTSGIDLVESGHSMPVNETAKQEPYQLIIQLLPTGNPNLALLHWRRQFPNTPWLYLPVNGQGNSLLQLLQRNLSSPETTISKNLCTATNHLDQLSYLLAHPPNFLTDQMLGEQHVAVRFFGCLGFASAKGTARMTLGKKPKALLAYLLLETPRAIHKDILMQQFWPDSFGKCRNNSLHVAINSIKQWAQKELGVPDLIQYQHDCYGLSSNIHLVSDYQEFRHNYYRGIREHSASTDQKLLYLAKAVMLQLQPLLEDLIEFRWASALRYDLQEHLHQALTHLQDLIQQESRPFISEQVKRRIAKLEIRNQQ